MKCLVCKKKHKTTIKTCFDVVVENLVDRIGVDMYEIGTKDRIIMVIYYFRRNHFAKVVKSKKGCKIFEFLTEIYAEFPFKRIISDNGREFMNKKNKTDE